MRETLDQKIARLSKEDTAVEEYRDEYPQLFLKEKEYLIDILPQDIVKRVEHFGSTAIPGIVSKPIVDILVEVTSLDQTKEFIVPILEELGYEYLWRPTINMDPPWYCWFIKRNGEGKRTHHIHMIEEDFKMWERLYFRDYLREFPEEAKRYGDLKRKLSKRYPNDRTQYTLGKSELILEQTEKAKRYFESLLDLRL